MPTGQQKRTIQAEEPSSAPAKITLFGPVSAHGFTRYFFLGIPVSTRPDLGFLEQQIARQIDSLLAIPLPTDGQSGGAEDDAVQAGRQRLANLPSYRLMCKARDGAMRLEDELPIVTAQAEQGL